MAYPGTINNFKQEVLDRGLARPNLFFINVGPAGSTAQRLGLSCHAAQIPGINIATTDKDIGLRSIAYNQIYSDIILSFYCDTDMHMYKFWEDWCANIINPYNRRTNYYTNYVQPIEIIQLNRQKQAVTKWELQDAYPKQIDPISLDYSSSGNVTSINVTITYRKFHTTYLDGNSGFESSEHGIEIFAANMSQQLHQLVDGMGSDLQDYYFSTWDFFIKELGQQHNKDNSPRGGAGASNYTNV